MDEVKAQVQHTKEEENRKSVTARKQVKRTILKNDSDAEPEENFT